MKFFISTLHQSYYKDHGKIRFENFPFDAETLQEAAKAAFSLRKDPNPWSRGRDLWRDSPPLLQFFLKKLIPLAMNLIGQNGVRILADQMIPQDFDSKAPLDTLFGFQPILCLASIEKGAITFYHPTMPLSQEVGYYIALGGERSCYIKKETDPCNHLLKKMDYSFGDKLKNETHPLVYNS